MTPFAEETQRHLDAMRKWNALGMVCALGWASGAGLVFFAGCPEVGFPVWGASGIGYAVCDVLWRRHAKKARGLLETRQQILRQMLSEASDNG